MVQIAFLTFFLGLTSRVQQVDLSVAGEVARVELQLDGAVVASLAEPPWSQEVDFGPDLVPHELVARALGADGAELARVRQWVNLPRPPADVAIVLEGSGPAGPTAARLAWGSLVAGAPKEISLSFDGKPLKVDPQGKAVLPPQNPELPHLLSAELKFANGIVARSDALFGAGGGEASGELTALPLRLRGGEMPGPERLQGWFTAGGAPVRAVAVEAEGGEVVVVRDGGARPPLMAISGSFRGKAIPGTALRRSDRLRFLSTRPRLKRTGSQRAEIYESSQPFAPYDGGLHFLLPRVAAPETGEEQRLTDALAVAGIEALAGNRARAVVLVLGPHPADASRYRPAAIRRYLAALRVPLHVWSVVPPAESPYAAEWTIAEDISSRPKLMAAIGALRDDLASQRIVFLEGLHLPQSIALTPAAAGVELP